MRLPGAIQLMDNPGHTTPYFKVLAMRDLHQLILGILRLQNMRVLPLITLGADPTAPYLRVFE